MKALEYAVLLSPLPEDEGGGFVATVPACRLHERWRNA